MEEEEIEELEQPLKKKSSGKKKNSEIYPADVRPEAFANNEAFDCLSADKAADVVLHHYNISKKMAMKESTKNVVEKTDDKLRKVKIAAGEDDAFDNIHVEARKKLRPINKEIEDQMDFFVRERKEIIRNLPLNAYGLQDSVSTKAVGLFHNLASNIKIEMFSLNNLKTSLSNQKQTATCKDGKLVVETDDACGELTSVMDVVKAWNTLDCVWQRIFPEWPVAKIALRVIFNMKMFSHCGSKAQDVVVTFSNRMLAKNSSLAAN